MSDSTMLDQAFPQELFDEDVEVLSAQLVAGVLDEFFARFPEVDAYASLHLSDSDVEALLESVFDKVVNLVESFGNRYGATDA